MGEEEQASLSWPPSARVASATALGASALVPPGRPGGIGD